MEKFRHEDFMNVLPRYFFVKRQIKGVKGWEVNYNNGSSWPFDLGFYKTMKEAREAVIKHKKLVSENKTEV